MNSDNPLNIDFPPTPDTPVQVGSTTSSFTLSTDPQVVAKPDQEVQEAIRQGTIDTVQGDEASPGTEASEETSEPENGSDSPENDGIDEERPSLSVETAFVVFFQDGSAFGIGNIGQVSVSFEGEEVYLEPQRAATEVDMWRGSAEVAKDIEVHQTAAQTVQAMQRHTLEMQAALMQKQREGQRLHVPGQ